MKIFVRRIRLRQFSAVALAAVVLAACLNPPSDAGTTDSTDGTLSLLAFTTSKPAWRATLPAFAGTAEGK